jgi:hypothetical protein
VSPSTVQQISRPFDASAKFPKHIYHSIICIGALIAHWQSDSQAARSTQMSPKK